MPSGKIKTLRAAILAILGSAAGSGLLAADAAARVLASRDEDEIGAPLLLAPPQVDPSELLAHSSHRSHQSHSSHRSHSSGGHGTHYSSPSYPSHSGSSNSGSSNSGSSNSGGSSSSHSGGSSSSDNTSRVPNTPRPSKPAKVSFVALPGGTIFVDGKNVGDDQTGILTLKAGIHQVKVQNRFLGDHEHVLTLAPGQSGTVTIQW
jgi:hypothetical protein